MTGLEVLAWTKEHTPDIPIIIISGTGMLHDVAEALRLGAWDYIFKPIEDLAVLGHAINKALERATLIRDNRNYQSHLEAEVKKRTLKIEQGTIEEHAIGSLLQLSIQAKDAGDFLTQSLALLLSSFKAEKETQGALFIRSCGDKQLHLESSSGLSDQQLKQCYDSEYTKKLLAEAEEIFYENSSTISPDHYYKIPVFIKRGVLAIAVIFYPTQKITHSISQTYLKRVSDVLSMGCEKFEAEKKIQYLAYHDALTGLPNRCMLLEKLQDYISQAIKKHCFGALLFIDIDRFKNLNDALGHLLGDELLKQVAARLVHLLKDKNLVSRLGGDEFVVLLMQDHDSEKMIAADALQFAEKIRETLTQPFNLQGHDYYITSSIGISLFPVEDGDADTTDLLKHADTAMFLAKTDGGDTNRFYQPTMQKAAEERLSLEKDLRFALENNELALYYQPQVVIPSGKIIGAEALLRWHHKIRGWVSPAKFIPIAEETGLILDIGHWVLRTVVQQIQQWEQLKLLKDINNIAANVSPLQFRQPHFVEQVQSIIREFDITPALLKLEITESTVIDNVEEIIQKMHKLKSFGLHFSMDDFGTGYSSLSYLRKLPLDQLKIDQSFVHDITTDKSDAMIVETIISMGHHLGLDVIAEGVESDQEIQFLHENGCNSYQGYFCSKPIPANEFEQLIIAQNITPK